MITRENLKEVINSLTDSAKKRILNTEKEYVVLYSHIHNSGSYTTVRLTDNFNRYKNVSNFGNAILYTDEVKDLIINGLAEKVLDFAKNHKDGFTLNINTLRPIQSGFVVSYKETQNSFSETDLQSVVCHAVNHDGVVGGWYNSENGKYYFDSNKVFNTNDLAEAIQFGLDNSQLAIFDIDNCKEIRLDK